MPDEPGAGDPTIRTTPSLEHQPGGSPGAGQPPRYREVTLAALAFALAIGVIMNAAITYAGLKIGFTIGGSAIAAVLGFGVLRGVARRFIPGAGTVLETNIAQTAASAINTSNSGIIFTVPVLLLIGIPLSWTGADFWLITLACVGGAILGAAFIIPLRKQMIDIDRLRFPTGTGVAVILKSPGAGAAKSIVLVLGILLSAAIYLPTQGGTLQRTASTDQLPRLVDEERITEGEQVITLAISGMIENQQAPPEVVARGRAIAEYRAASEELKAATEVSPVSRVLGAVGMGSEPTEEEQAEQKAEVERLWANVSALRAGLPEFEAAGFNDELCLAAYRATEGIDGASWEDLRQLKTGWAMAPMFGGYADAQIRMPEAAEGEALPVYADHDGNAKPDLLITDEKVDAGRFLGLPGQFEMIFAIAPFALGAGFITGKAGLLVLAGGILAYFVLTPVAFSMGWMPESLQAHEAPGHGFGTFNRPLGIGLLLGGALMGIAASLPAIGAALKSIAAASKAKGGRDELGLTPLIFAAIAAVGLLFLAADTIGNKPVNRDCPVTMQQVDQFAEGDPAASLIRPTSMHQGYTIRFANDEAAATWNDEWDDGQRDEFLASINAKPGWLASLGPHTRAALIAIIGGLWIWLAGIIIAQCTGMTDWSPISGMALLTVVLVMMLAGTGAVVGAVLIGAALCVAITLAADMMQDLRTGHLLGAKPRRQQMVELCVVGIGPAISMIVVVVIAQANLKLGGPALGPGAPNGAAAPQAQALQAVITGVQGGEMPYALYGFGALMGALLGLGAFSGLGVLVGLSMYLPFEYIATYGIGCVAQMVLSKVIGKRRTEEWGVPFAAGLIVGESILALFINLYVLGAT